MEINSFKDRFASAIEEHIRTIFADPHPPEPLEIYHENGLQDPCLLDSDTIRYFVLIFSTINYELTSRDDLGNLQLVTQQLSPMLESFGYTSGREESDDVIGTLYKRVTETYDQLAKEETEKEALDGTENLSSGTVASNTGVSTVSVLSLIEKSNRSRTIFFQSQRSRQLDKQKMNYMMQKQEDVAAASIAKRLLKGKAVAFETEHYGFTKEELQRIAGETNSRAFSNRDADRVVDEVMSISHGTSNERVGLRQTIDTESGMAIDMHDVTLAFGSNVLLQDVSLQLYYGRRYGLHARNGCGKSTLLRAIANGEIPCVVGRERVKVFYANQEAPATDEAVIDCVMSADVEYIVLHRLEQAMLFLQDFEGRVIDAGIAQNSLNIAQVGSQDGQDNTAELYKNIRAASQALLSIVNNAKISYYFEDLDTEFLAPVSGSTIDENSSEGADENNDEGESYTNENRKLNDNEDDDNELLKHLDVNTGRGKAENMRVLDGEVMSHIIEAVYNTMNDLNMFNARARATEILLGLGFTQASILRKTRDLSGGWRMRVTIAQALFVNPDCMFLDEVTNHIDLHCSIYLENYLTTKFNKMLILVSHDIDFIDAVATNILHLSNKKVRVYNGNYSSFTQQRMAEIASSESTMKRVNNETKHLQSYVDRFRFNAKLASLAQSRIKTIKKITEMAALDQDIIEGAEAAKREGMSTNFRFPCGEEIKGNLLELKEVAFSYSKQAVGGFRLKDCNFAINAQQKIAIMGPNGAGKSTLIKLITGALKPTDGSIIMGSTKLAMSIFWQHTAESLDYTKTPYQIMADFNPNASQQAIKQQLSNFGLQNNIIFQPVKTLSGGQKVRVSFACLTFDIKPSLLILDEPTNQLDVETLAALIRALNEYEGAVLMVSHNSQLVQSVATDIYVVDNGTIQRFDGDYAQYRQSLKNKYGY